MRLAMRAALLALLMILVSSLLAQPVAAQTAPKHGMASKDPHERAAVMPHRALPAIIKARELHGKKPLQQSAASQEHLLSGQLREAVKPQSRIFLWEIM
jgi:hypothetical protein